MGRDPSTITREKLREEFNPRHVWTEFVNRLFSLPVGAFSLATFIVSFQFGRRRPLVFWMSFSALLLVLANAIMGARVVYSGISPGVLSTHLALAMLLICVLVYCVWAGTERPLKLPLSSHTGLVRALVAGLLLLTVAEGILGSQIREMTDHLAKLHQDAPRETWIAELEESGVYLFHRSFSWLILAVTVWVYALARQSQPGGATPTQNGVLAVTIAQMLLGIVMAQVHIYSWVQVLHVGLAAILLALVFRWLLTIPNEKRPPALADGR